MRLGTAILFVCVLVVSGVVTARSPASGVAPGRAPTSGAVEVRPERSLAPFPTVLLDGRAPVSGTAERPLEPECARLWEPINWKINSDSTTELQNEEQIVVNPTDPDNLVAIWRDFRLGYRRVGVGYSLDGGISWHDSLLEEPTYPRQSDPGLTYDRFGNIYAVVLSYTGSTSEPNGLFVYRSEDGGVTWGEPVPVVDGVPGVFEDKELIACDRTGGPRDGHLYVVWDRFGWETEIMCARSAGWGSGFESPVRVSDEDGVQWPVPAVGPDGALYVAWTQYWPSSIRIDRSFDGGASFGSDLTVTSTYTPYAEINGGIAVFAFPAMDVDVTGGPYDGRLYIAYMDTGGGDYDIYFRRSDDQGLTWSAPVRVNDDAYGNGRDQFHPWTCVSADGVVNVVFYDRRNDPGNLCMDVYLAQSFDGGASFEPNVRVTTVSSDPTAGSARAGLIGEYIGVAALSAARVHPVWTDTREGNQDVYTSMVDTTFVGVPEVPPSGALALAAAPNPFSGSVELALTAVPGERIDTAVYDAGGRLVRSLPLATDARGRGSVVWNGTDGEGHRVAAGVYFVRASSKRGQASSKIVLLR